MLAWVRGIPELDASMRKEQWIYRSGREIAGATVAVIGFGNIGRSVAALDVFADEPCAPAKPGRDLRSLSNAVLTCHSGSKSPEAKRRMAEACICIVQAWYAEDSDKLVPIPERTD